MPKKKVVEKTEKTKPVENTEKTRKSTSSRPKIINKKVDSLVPPKKVVIGEKPAIVTPAEEVPVQKKFIFPKPDRNQVPSAVYRMNKHFFPSLSKLVTMLRSIAYK